MSTISDSDNEPKQGMNGPDNAPIGDAREASAPASLGGETPAEAPPAESPAEPSKEQTAESPAEEAAPSPPAETPPLPPPETAPDAPTERSAAEAAALPEDAVSASAPAPAPSPADDSPLPPQAAAPVGHARRPPVFWMFAAIGVLILICMIAIGLRGPDARYAPMEGAPDAIPALPPSDLDSMMSRTTLAMRKKLDFPFDLQFSQADLTKVLALIEKKIDVRFDYQADLSALESVTLRAEGKPLREILGDVFSRRNLGFILQRDSIVIIACAQNVKTSFLGSVRKTVFSAEFNIECLVGEPVELYCGDKGQYRVRLLALSTGEQDWPYRIFFSLYESSRLLDYSSLAARPSEWAEAPVETEDELALMVRLETADGVHLTLGAHFLYTEKREAAG